MEYFPVAIIFVNCIGCTGLKQEIFEKSGIEISAYSLLQS
jgi:hypothetical protein